MNENAEQDGFVDEVLGDAGDWEDDESLGQKVES